MGITGEVDPRKAMKAMDPSESPFEMPLGGEDNAASYARAKPRGVHTFAISRGINRAALHPVPRVAQCARPISKKQLKLVRRHMERAGRPGARGIIELPGGSPEEIEERLIAAAKQRYVDGGSVTALETEVERALAGSLGFDGLEG